MTVDMMLLVIMTCQVINTATWVFVAVKARFAKQQTEADEDESWKQ